MAGKKIKILRGLFVAFFMLAGVVLGIVGSLEGVAEIEISGEIYLFAAAFMVAILVMFPVMFFMMQVLNKQLFGNRPGIFGRAVFGNMTAEQRDKVVLSLFRLGAIVQAVVMLGVNFLIVQQLSVISVIVGFISSGLVVGTLLAGVVSDKLKLNSDKPEMVETASGTVE